MNRSGDAELEGRLVTVMGLGLFGGGAAAARFLARRGARVTVTDLRSSEELEPALAELRELPLRYVLGEHRKEDFTECSLVVANPAVPPGNRYLAAARRGTWNNARLHQYRTYNDAREGFERLLEAETGDLRAFIGEVDRLTRGAADPEAAIAAAAGPSGAVQKK